MDLKSPSDIRSLTQAIVHGSDAAFETFYELYGARLYRFLLVVALGNEEMAREVQQVVMIKVSRKFRVFETDSALWAWLAQVARNAFVDQVRKQSRYGSRAALDQWLVVDGMDNGAADEALAEWLDQGLLALDGEDRELIDRVYFQGRAQKELAAASGTTLKSIESKLARIRERLRQYVFRRMKHDRESI